MTPRIRPRWLHPQLKIHNKSKWYFALFLYLKVCIWGPKWRGQSAHRVAELSANFNQLLVIKLFINQTTLGKSIFDNTTI